MKITVTTASGEIFELDVSETLELENLKAICESIFGIPPSDKCVFKCNEIMLTDPQKSLKDYGIMDGDYLQIISDEEKAMKITIITALEQIIELRVSEGLELENLKAMCELKLGIPLSDKCVFKWQGEMLMDPKKCLKDYGITDGELLQMLFHEEKTMKIAIITRIAGFDNITEFDVSEGLELGNLKAMCESKLGIPPSDKCVFKWQGRLLMNHKKCLKDYGITNGDFIYKLSNEEHRTHSVWTEGWLLHGVNVEKDLDFENITVRSDDPHLEDPEIIRQLYLKDPSERAILKERNPPLSEALETGNAERFAEMFNRQQMERFEKEQERLRLLKADQSDPEVIAYQKEQERLQKVEENMEDAVEFVPESLCQVPMMYINCKVNKYPVKAFVDTGAQMTIMNRSCAERCNIIHLVDYRWAGIAVGVGTQRIVGRVHLVEIEIGSAVLPSSLSILEDQPVEMILGLDLLKRHMCTIDLPRNVLVIKTINGDVIETPFLPESELPPSARLTLPKR